VPSAASAASGSAGSATALPRALPSPLPDLPCTPGLREAVAASRSKHEAAFAAEKKVLPPPPLPPPLHAQVLRPASVNAGETT
jgi:hypothetical protein